MGVMLIALFVFSASISYARELVNSIKARVNDSVILHSDLQHPQISKDGAFATLDELIKEELLFQRAEKRNMLPSDSEVSAQIISLKRENGLIGKSDVECDAFLRKAIGIDFATYKKQLCRFLAVRNVKTYDLGQRCIVTSDEIKEYFDKNPQYTPAKYRFKMATISPEQVSLNREFSGDYGQLSWDDLGWLKQHEIARHLHSVMSLRPGEYSKPISHNGDYVMVSLIDKAPSELIPLEKRYAYINDSLQEQKQEQAADDFSKELRESAVITLL